MPNRSMAFTGRNPRWASWITKGPETTTLSIPISPMARCINVICSRYSAMKAKKIRQTLQGYWMDSSHDRYNVGSHLQAVPNVRCAESYRAKRKINPLLTKLKGGCSG